MPNAETELGIIRKSFLRRSSLESSVRGKRACTVREGGDGKGPSRAPRRRPTSLRRAVRPGGIHRNEQATLKCLYLVRRQGSACRTTVAVSAREEYVVICRV